MKAKTIKKIIRQKVHEWIKSIDDSKLRENVAQNCIVTGGAIASMLLGENVNDYDVYFTNKETAKRVAEYYVKKFKDNPPSTYTGNKRNIPISVVDEKDRIKIVIKSEGVASEEIDPQEQPSLLNVQRATHFQEKEKESGKYRPIFLSSNAITLSDDVQLIIRFYGSPEEIHKNYDFVHCTNYWASSDDELTLRPKALEALLAKELVYIGSRYPLASIIRTRKFIKRGFTCNAGQYLKMCWQVAELDLYDIEVLEDQLVGVDTAYFQMLIDTIKAEISEDPDFGYDYPYIAELIDRIF